MLALEASRLARNNRDWHHLIDLCAMADTLVIDHDGVYDPSLLNDRLLLGLKGTMSEFEISLLRQRAMEAHKEKVRRGLVLTQVPIGYVRTEDEGIEKTPDHQIQESIRGIFRKFRELGSVRHLAIEQRWYPSTALDDLLEIEKGKINDTRLYRCLNHILPHKTTGTASERALA